MKTKSAFIAAIAATTLLAGTAAAQRGGAASQGRPGNAPAQPALEHREDVPRPQASGNEQAKPANEERTQARSLTPFTLAEKLAQQSDWSRQLGLTPEQNATVVRIRDQQRSEIQAITDRWLLTQSQKEKRIREAQQKHDREIRALLMPDQLRRLEELQMSDHDRLRDQLKTDAAPKN